MPSLYPILVSLLRQVKKLRAFISTMSEEMCEKSYLKIHGKIIKQAILGHISGHILVIFFDFKTLCGEKVLFNFDSYCQKILVEIEKIWRFARSFLVEHRGVEPLTSTMRMSRATNCANAPYGFPEVFRGSLPRFTSAGRVTIPFILKGFP